MRRLWLAIPLGAAAIAPAVSARPQSAQPPQQAPQSVFRAGTDVVELDVSVFDKDRHPVRGLTKADFTILEDSRPQPIVGFSPVDIPDPPPITAPWMKMAPVDVDTNDFSRGRLFVILMDDDNLRDIMTAPHDFESTRVVARKVIDGLGPDDLATVVLSRDNWEGQGFTADHARLYDAVARLVTNPTPIKSPVRCRFLQSLDEVVTDLAVIPHRRKVVVGLSQASTCSELGMTAGTLGGAVVDRANSADINVYAIDPHGLGPRPLPGGGTDIPFLQSLSENTGGHAIVNTNTPEARVPEIFAENQSYYLLGYESHNLKTRESLKRIEVKVDRPGVTVRTQTVYDAPAPEGSEKPKAELPPATKAILDVVPKTDLPLRAAALALPGPGGQSIVAVVIGVHEPAGVPAATDRLDVTVRAFTPDGRDRGSTHEVAAIGVRSGPATPSAAAQAEVLARLALAPGRYNLRISAHSQTADRDGSIYTDVIVPDFAKDPLALSGLALTATAGPRAVPRDVLATAVPIVPTAERTFARTQSVAAFVRVAEGGSSPAEAVTMRLKVVDDRNTTVLDRASILPAGAFGATRSADYRGTLPIASWHPGAYLVSVSATAGSHVATREVRIDVR